VEQRCCLRHHCGGIRHCLLPHADKPSPPWTAARQPNPRGRCSGPVSAPYFCKCTIRVCREDTRRSCSSMSFILALLRHLRASFKAPRA
jgi:hypothetical protein